MKLNTPGMWDCSSLVIKILTGTIVLRDYPEVLATGFNDDIHLNNAPDE
jgi:hypothetical protein